MNNLAAVQASDCIKNLRLSISCAEFGYKMQAMAAHVLLRLNCQVEEINHSGHPDIVATRGMEELRFEIEAEVVGSRPRQLEDGDFASLINVSGAIGYFALAISFPTPRWILVPAERLVGRKPSSPVLLEALSDRDFSEAWTYEYINLLSAECRRVGRSSFGSLCERALAGRGSMKWGPLGDSRDFVTECRELKVSPGNRNLGSH